MMSLLSDTRSPDLTHPTNPSQDPNSSYVLCMDSWGLSRNSPATVILNPRCHFSEKQLETSAPLSIPTTLARLGTFAPPHPLPIPGARGKTELRAPELPRDVDPVVAGGYLESSPCASAQDASSCYVRSPSLCPPSTLSLVTAEDMPGTKGGEREGGDIFGVMRKQRGVGGCICVLFIYIFFPSRMATLLANSGSCVTIGAAFVLWFMYCFKKEKGESPPEQEGVDWEKRGHRAPSLKVQRKKRRTATATATTHKTNSNFSLFTSPHILYVFLRRVMKK
eukprot:Hpha_TRINITY_DN16337_c2_g1::TRINITY_DN16337_c2_g1_i3::g.60846::m.60846